MVDRQGYTKSGGCRARYSVVGVDGCPLSGAHYDYETTAILIKQNRNTKALDCNRLVIREHWLLPQLVRSKKWLLSIDVVYILLRVLAA